MWLESQDFDTGEGMANYLFLEDLVLLILHALHCCCGLFLFSPAADWRERNGNGGRDAELVEAQNRCETVPCSVRFFLLSSLSLALSLLPWNHSLVRCRSHDNREKKKITRWMKCAAELAHVEVL